MDALFICHPDFADVEPVNVFYKEMKPVKRGAEPPQFQNRHILFRRKITLEKVGKAVMEITADDYYKLYINGRYVGQGPAAGYPQAYNTNSIEVTDYLHNGENTIAVHTYYQGLVNRVWVSADRRQMLWCKLAVDGRTALVSDTSWKVGEHTAYSSCGRFGYDTQFAEVYDSGAPEVGFEQPQFDDSAWKQAAVATRGDWKLVPQSTALLDIYEVAPKRVEPIPGGLRIDLGFEAVGYLSAKAKGPKGTVIVRHYGEELDSDGSVRWKLRCNCNYEEKWILSGGDDILNEYDYKAYRYAELLFPAGVTVSDIKFVVRHYPFAEKAVYKTDKTMMKAILKLCSDTVKYGTQENYVDCPTREKGQYSGDVSIAARAQATITGDTTMMKKALRDFCESSFICPGLMTCSCSSLMQEIADYSLQFPAQIAWVYSIDHDKEFLKYTEPYVTACLNYFLNYCNEDGLLDGVTEKWNLVDWPANLRDGYAFPLTKPIGKGVHNVLNAFWVGFLQSTDEIYGLLGKPATGLTEQVKTAYIKTFYSRTSGLFVDSPATSHASIHSNLLPLLFGIGTEDAALKARLIAFITKKKLSSMGVYMAYFTLAALVRNGERELAEQLTLDSGCWLLMLSEGATTTFEAWGKDQKWNTSLFHPWATAPLIVFAEGVRPY